MKTWLLLESKSKDFILLGVTQADNILSLINKYNDLITVTSFTTKKEAEKRIELIK